MFMPMTPAWPGEIITPAVRLCLLVLIMLAFLYLIFRPQALYVYAITAMVSGLAAVLTGADIIGFTFCILGFFIAFRQGFFRNRAKIKLFALVTMLMSAILLQYRVTATKIIYSLLHLFLMLFMMGFLFFLFRQYFLELLPAGKGMEKIHLADYDLAERDYDFIRRVLKNEKYTSIAADSRMSLSSVKQRMSAIYKKFGVNDRNEFFLLSTRYEMVFPADATTDIPVISPPETIYGRARI